MKIKRGKFIVFEGLDGSGKTTQATLLAARLQAVHIPAVITREPSDSNMLGLVARSAVKGMISLSDEAMALLFAADRYEHTVKEILPRLQAGYTLICDRFYFSNFAYQGAAVGLEKLRQYNETVMHMITPDMTILLDMPPDECLRRLTNGRTVRPEYFENKEALYTTQRYYRQAFEMIRNIGPVLTLQPGDLTADALAEQIWAQLRHTVFSDNEV